MFTSDQVRLARLALYSYDYANRPDRDRFNRTGIPDGWTQIDERPNDVTGFLSQAFLNASETQLVVSFAGTRFEPGNFNPKEPDFITDINGAVGDHSANQFGDAVRFFRDLMANPNIPDAAKQNVVFTGHSLGGGMAGFMGVMFDLPSLGFASAPFQLKAMRPAAVEKFAHYESAYLPHFDKLLEMVNISTSTIRTPQERYEDLQEIVRIREQKARGIAIEGDAITWYMQNVDELPSWLSEAASAAWIAYLARKSADKASEYIAKRISEWITGVSDVLDTDRSEDIKDIDNEEVWTPSNLYFGENNYQFIPVFESEMSAMHRHSMAWHLVLMDHALLYAEVSRIPKLANIITDRFGSNPYSEDEQILINKLINNHYGATDKDGDTYIEQNFWLDEFATEIHRISQLSGDQLESDRITGLIAAVASYFWYLPNGTEDVPEFFVQKDWGLSFNLALIDRLPGEAGGEVPVSEVFSRAEELWELIGDEVPVGNLQSGAVFNRLTLDQIQPIGSAALWHVQLGAGAMQFEGGATNEVFIGGDAVGDDISGGAGHDVMVGRSGDDTLRGDAGNDTLIGGQGSDRYVFEAGEGRDVIIDRDGQGTLVIGGKELSKAEKILTLDGLRTWIDRDNDLVLKYKPDAGRPQFGTLFISGPGLGGDGNQIEIRNYRMASDFTSGDLGLAFESKSRLVLLGGSVNRNPFLDAAFDEADVDNTVTISEGGGHWLTIALNTISDQPQFVRLTAQGAPDLRLMVKNNEIVEFGGAIDIIIPAGQTMGRVGIHHAGKINATTNITFTASYAPADDDDRVVYWGSSPSYGYIAGTENDDEIAGVDFGTEDWCWRTQQGRHGSDRLFAGQGEDAQAFIARGETEVAKPSSRKLRTLKWPNFTPPPLRHADSYTCC